MEYTREVNQQKKVQKNQELFNKKRNEEDENIGWKGDKESEFEHDETYQNDNGQDKFAF